MTTRSDTRTATDSPAIPRPRSPQQDAAPAPAPTASAPEQEPAVPMTVAPAVGQYPWPEPWRYSRAARPRSEFWDVTTASWHSRGPYPEAQQD
jgi:hypothetical protein